MTTLESSFDEKNKKTKSKEQQLVGRKRPYRVVSSQANTLLLKMFGICINSQFNSAYKTSCAFYNDLLSDLAQVTVQPVLSFPRYSFMSFLTSCTVKDFKILFSRAPARTRRPQTQTSRKLALALRTLSHNVSY